MANISTTTDLIINRLSQAKYDQLCASGQLNNYQLYMTDYDPSEELSAAIGELCIKLEDVWKKSETSSASQLSMAFDQLSDYYTKSETSSAIEIDNAFGNYYMKSDTSSASEISNALSTKADLSSVEHIVQYEEDLDGNYTAVTIGSRDPNANVGPNSFVNGRNGLATGYYSHAEGYETYAAAYAHAEGGHTSALADTSHAECYYSIAGNQGAHAEGGYTSAFGYYSHTEGGWTSTGANAIGAHAEGGFTRADGPISHVEGIKAAAELSDYQSFVWQGTDVMPNELTDITPSTWDEYKAHGPGTFNINPAKGLNGVYIGETSLYDLVKDDNLTIIKFDNGEARAFAWSGDISQTTMINAGLYDENEGSWTLNPTHVRIGNGVTSIKDSVFYGCSGLTNVTIPSSVTSIKDSVFYGCSGLTNVTIPSSVTSIGSVAFGGCSGLTIVTIPASVTSIGSSAFYGCSGLTSVVIPDSVESIGYDAFSGCSSLMGIIIGKNVAVVGNNAFENCTSLSNDSNLSSITIDKGNWEKLFNDIDFEYYRSNRISDDESTSMSVSVEASESFQVMIKLKTSSEEDYDILTLTLDGQELTSMSGITDWQYLSATIPSGSHTAVLTYSKDGSISSGDDHAYFAIVQGCIVVKGKTQEEAEQLLADASVPETCKIITIDDSSASGENQTNVTYVELAQMRNNGSLAPGMKYRITDYVTKIDQEDCRSAEHPFDLIVTAIDYHTLDEHAVATLPSNGDDYFAARPFHVSDYQQYLEYARVPLESWDIKYCLDNDKSRFKFADTVDGKGVIYYMKDEFGNEAPYDFKNVQFKRYKITSSPGATGLEGMYGLAVGNIEVDTSDEMWCYTFNGVDYADFGLSEPYDFSGWHVRPTQAVLQQFGSPSIQRLQECTGNVIQAKHQDQDDFSLMSFKLPNNVFHCALNITPVDELPFLKIGYCGGNKLGLNCYDNTFGDSQLFNVLGDLCYSNTFGSNCNYNTFGNNCYSNTFGNDCRSNSFGNDCNSNSFSYDCDNNTFGDYCVNNTFGDYCINNTFGSDCDSNSFGSDCAGNTFGNGCNRNTFGNDCDSNTFCDNCSYIKFALTDTSDPTQAKSYYRYINIDSGNSYIILNCTQSTYDGHEYKNVRILPGVNNTTIYKTITDNNVNQSFCTTYQPANSQVIAI